jgi:hypothetical protein
MLQKQLTLQPHTEGIIVLQNHQQIISRFYADLSSKCLKCSALGRLLCNVMHCNAIGWVNPC